MGLWTFTLAILLPVFSISSLSAPVKKKILIVDDNQLQRELLTVYLKKKHEIIAVRTHKEALQSLQARAFDMLILDYDYKYEKQNGFQFAEGLLPLYPNILILIRTSKKMEDVSEIKGLTNDQIFQKYRVLGLFPDRENQMGLFMERFERIEKLNVHRKNAGK